MNTSDGPADSPSPVDNERRDLLTWLWRVPVLAALAGVGWGAWEAYHVHFDKVRPEGAPRFTSLGPQRVAPLNTFADVWDAATFNLAGTPGIALRLPEAVPGALNVGGAHYAAYSQVCTHLGCTVNLNRNVEALAVAFNYRTDTPALACPCHLSVFAPLQAGEAVSGPAREPLPRIQLGARDGVLYAVGLEEAG